MGFPSGPMAAAVVEKRGEIPAAFARDEFPPDPLVRADFDDVPVRRDEFHHRGRGGEEGAEKFAGLCRPFST